MTGTLSAHDLKAWFPLVTLAMVLAVVGILDAGLLRPASLMQLAADVSTLFIMALGITFVISIGDIDLWAQPMVENLEIPAQAQQISLGAVLVVAIAATIDRAEVRTVQ